MIRPAKPEPKPLLFAAPKLGCLRRSGLDRLLPPRLVENLLKDARETPVSAVWLI